MSEGPATPESSARPSDSDASLRSRRLLGRIVGVGIVVGAIGVSIWVYRELVVWPRTDDAYVRANTVGIAPHVSGPIVELPIVDNQPVEEGEVLFVVDPRPYLAALEQAEAELLLTDLEIEGLERAERGAGGSRAASWSP